MTKHFLVTGGAGFVGSALIRHLNEHGHTTSCIDRHPQHSVTGHEVIRDLLIPRNFEDDLDRIHRQDPVDRVIHLAAQVGREIGEDDFRHTIRSNAEMTAEVAQATAKRGIELAYASTSEVYGDQNGSVCRESSTLALPHNLYGLSKRWGEEICGLYNRKGLLIWRLSMPYGPGAPPGRGRRAMDNMLWQAQHGKKIPVHKGAERSWCWIGDTVEAMRLTLDHDYLHANPGIFNIGRDDDPRLMMDIAKMACNITGANVSLIEVVNPPERQTIVKRLSTDKIRRMGWMPTVELEEGMARLNKWIAEFDEKGRRVAA